MRRLRRFLALPAADRRLLVEAALFLWAIRLGLRMLPFRTLWRLLDGAPRAFIGLPTDRPFAPDRIAWAVSVTSQYVLGTRPCLPQALAAQLLLVRRGLPACLRLGVAKGDRGEVQAHAWMETDGRIVTGGSKSELERYTPLLVLNAQAR
ncbi:MAG TPA: lasso peptide biosynthesis B2 protein [Candidatus Binatia bacterium]|nr:lasso peptide biosynthesis B2 protein [Candidatus Binatia bacterium]